MTTGDWALIISIGSFLVAICSFVWNVWSKFIYPKPVVKTYISKMNIVNDDGTFGTPVICLSATNFGPSDITLYAAVAKSKTMRKGRIGVLNPLSNFPNDMTSGSGPFSGGLPKKISTGEQFSVYFPVSKRWFTEKDLNSFGFSDTFGRYHWCHKTQAKKFKIDVVNDSN